MKTKEKVLIVKADKKGYVDCPFCFQKHKHGNTGRNGHRVPDCGTLLVRNPVIQNGTWFSKRDGYYVVFE